jgi:hypothetical protein
MRCYVQRVRLAHIVVAMQMNVVDQEYWNKLFGLYSFIRGDAITDDMLCVVLLADGEKLIGVYVNNADDFIMVTTLGLRWVHEGVERFVAYDAVALVDLPTDLQYRQLKMMLQDGNMVFLPVENETEGTSDLFVVYDFLMAATYWPFTGWDSELPIADISSPGDVAHFIGQLDSMDINTVVALRGGFPTEQQLRRFSINPAIVHQPDAWRLVAAFLSIPRRSP